MLIGIYCWITLHPAPSIHLFEPLHPWFLLSPYPSSLSLFPIPLPYPSSHLFPIPQFLFAVSPLLALFVVIYNGFETKEEEEQRRNKKEDFTLAGHGD